MRSIFCLSLNHRVTSLEDRERVAFSQEPGVEFLRRLRDVAPVEEAVLLSTCNRTELYTVFVPSDDPAFDASPLEHFSSVSGFELRETPPNHVTARGRDAVTHLFRVAGGLESQIVGESQILAQVKTAMDWARDAGTDGRVTTRLWERALRVGKRVRSETAIGHGALSASTAALELARKVFRSFADRSVLVIGAGEIGALAVQNLAGVDVGSIRIVNRTHQRAVDFAELYGGEAIEYERLDEALVEADVVLSSTGATEPIVDYDRLRRVRARRGGSRPLLIVDLAMPRDFHPKCGTIDGVFLKNLDDLEEIVTLNRREREDQLPLADFIVRSEVVNFFDWLRSLRVEPTIVELRRRFEEIRCNELDALRANMGPEEFARLDEFSRRLINQLLHQPSENLKRHAAFSEWEAVQLVHELLTQDVPHPQSRRSTEGEESE